MLLFRSEEHRDRWLRDHDLRHGATLTLDQQWRLAQVWYHDRDQPGWRRRSPQEAEAVFADVGLDGGFWRLT